MITNMKKYWLLLISIGFIATFLVACSGGDSESSSGGAEATSDDPIVFKTGLTVGDWAPQHTAMSVLEEVLEEKSGGTMVIEGYPDSQLGGEREMLEGVQQGSLEIGLISSSVFAAFDERFTAIDIPYLVSSFEEAEAMMDGPVGEELDKMFEEIGMKNLAWGHNDFRIISNSVKTIETPEDLNGIKMRVPESQVLTDWYTNLGALSTTLPFPDIYNALQQGVVDGQDNGPILTHASKFTEHQDYVTVTKHQYSPVCFCINLDLWNSLSEEQQSMLQEAADEAAEEERKAIIDFHDMALEEMENAGVEVTHLTEEQLAEWQETGKAIAEKLSGEENPLLDVVLEEVGF